MDKTTLRAFIIENRELGKTFKEISDLLKERYDIEMSRQGVQGSYVRATSDKIKNNNKNMIIATADVVNFKALGINNIQIKELCLLNGINITSNDINSIIRRSEGYREDIERTQVVLLSKAIENDVDDLGSIIEYKGIKPTQKRLNYLISECGKYLINDKATEIIAKIFKASDNRELIKELMKEYNLKISFRDISNKLGN